MINESNLLEELLNTTVCFHVGQQGVGGVETCTTVHPDYPVICDPFNLANRRQFVLHGTSTRYKTAARWAFGHHYQSLLLNNLSFTKQLFDDHRNRIV